MRNLLASVLSVGLLSACGGAGGSSWLSFDRNPIMVTMYEGETPRVSLTGTANDEPSTSINIGVLIDGRLFSPGTDDIQYVDEWTQRFSARLLPLSVGTHEGFIEVRACEDEASTCAVPYGGSPWRIPVNVEVRANPGNPTSPANGDFSSGTTGWTSYIMNGMAGSVSAEDGALHVAVFRGGSDIFGVQAYMEGGLNLETGKTYRFAFDARADEAKTIGAWVEEGGDRDGDRRGAIYNQTLNEMRLTTSMQTYSTTFTMTETNRAAKVHFFVGGSDADIFIDNVTVTELP